MILKQTHSISVATTTITAAIMDTRTDINGLPAKYVLTKNPNDPSGETCVVVKVLDVDETEAHHNPIRIPSSYI